MIIASRFKFKNTFTDRTLVNMNYIQMLTRAAAYALSGRTGNAVV